MSKNIFHVAKRSEYRNNYLPFDYYDFMITAKENENLRFRNKIRDYLHTPFDWDEDQDFYIEQENEKFRNVSQATQTSVKPRHGHNHQYSDVQLKMKPSIKQSDNHQNNTNNQGIQQNNNIHNNQKKSEIRQTKSATVQINSDRMEKNDPRPNTNQKRSKSKSSRKNKNKAQNQGNQSNQNEFMKSHTSSNNHTIEKKVNNNTRKIDFKSISNMAVQTPLAWNLRDYNKTKPKRPLSRSASVSNLQPRRVPFANYGWATKTKDLSLKPTHNALANKTLARQNDRDAIVELTLHKLKKDAVHIANEYSAVESAVADQFHNHRSESKAWGSEYDEKYPDYSRSSSRNELYFTPNPNRLSKSTLVTDHPQLRRGPRSAKVKIFYNES